MKLVRSALVVLLLLSAFVATAQSDETYTFESGVAFSIPPDAELEEAALPELHFGDVMVIELIDPAFIGTTYEETIDAPLADVVIYLLGLVGHNEELNSSNAFRETLSDGRDTMGYVFVQESGIFQMIVAVRLSDGSVGALNMRTVSQPSDDQLATMLSVAESFDVAGEQAAPVIEVTNTLPNEYTFSTGTTFGYPDGYELTDNDPQPATLQRGNDIRLTLVDPAFISMSSGEPMEALIQFLMNQNAAIQPDFTPFDVGGREAMINTTSLEDVILTQVIVRLSDGTAGIIEAISFEPLSDTLIEDLRAIASTFDSASGQTTFTAEQRQQMTQLYETGREFYETGDLERAILMFDRALEMQSTFAAAHYWRGAAHYDLGNLDEALVDFENALRYFANDRQILVDIADTLVMLDRVDEAAEALGAYLANPGDSEVSPGYEGLLAAYESVAAGEFISEFYYGRANELRELGHFEDALRDVNTGLANEPTDTRWYALQSSVLVDMGQHEEAVSVLTKALAIEETALLFMNRGFAYQELILSDPDTLINSVNDLECALLLEDDTLSSQQRMQTVNALTRTVIDMDDYEPKTDVVDCAA